LKKIPIDLEKTGQVIQYRVISAATARILFRPCPVSDGVCQS
jgi:hypothetical protein